MVKALVENGAQVNAKGRDNLTALHEAAYEGLYDIVRVLIEHSADLNAVDAHGKTPLDLAAEEGHTDVVELLAGPGPGAEHTPQ